MNGSRQATGQPAEAPETRKPTAASGDQSGRDAGGRFTKGNQGGPGRPANPFARRMAHLRQVMMDRVADEDLMDIVDALIEKAAGGDLSAAKVILSYVVGKPSTAVDPDRIDVDEFDVFQAKTTTADAMCNPMEGTPVSMANDILRTALPGLEAEKRKTIRDGLLNEGLDEEDEDEEDEDDPLDERETDEKQETNEGRERESTAQERKRSEPEAEEAEEQPPEVPVLNAEEMLAVLEFIRLRNLHPSGVPSVPGVERQSESTTDKKRTETAARAANASQGDRGERRRTRQPGGGVNTAGVGRQSESDTDKERTETAGRATDSRPPGE